MQSFTFVHAADLHLDGVLPGAASGYSGTEEKGGGLPAILSRAPFEALDRLARLCVKKKAAFLLLAGDVFDRPEGSMQAYFALRDVCMLLRRFGISVFWARGNHDPWSGQAKGLQWPDNLFIFSPLGESHTVEIEGKPVAVVHGISHEFEGEQDNLAQRLGAKISEAGKNRLLNVGVMHCSVSGNSSGYAPYAPCALKDLTSQRVDYWALGHVHQPTALSLRPQVYYAGSLQGRHINETGPRGCYVVNVEGGNCTAEFTSLAPVCWQQFSIDLSELDENQPDDPDSGEGLPLLEAAVLKAVRGYADELRDMGQVEGVSAVPFLKSEALVCRIVLTGRTHLDDFLRKGGNVAELTARVNAALGADLGENEMILHVKDIRLKTRPDVDVDSLIVSGNLVGETLRTSEDVHKYLETLALEDKGHSLYSILKDAKSNPMLAQLSELQTLFDDPRMRKAILEADESGFHNMEPDAAELAEMVREAAMLSLDLFEVRS